MSIIWAFLFALGAQMTIPQQSPQSQSEASKAASETEIYDLGEGISAPQLLAATLPTIKGDICKDHLAGKVVVDLVVDADGNSEQVYLVDALGNDLDRLALLTAEVDHFRPATRSGKAVAVKESAEIAIESCVEVKTDGSGKELQMLRLKTQPLQVFGRFRTPRGSKAIKDMELPYPLVTPEAQFSAEAIQKRINAECFVSLTIDDHGLPQNIKVVRPVGHGLDEEAMKAILRYRFRPALKHGKPVPQTMTIDVRFRQ